MIFNIFLFSFLIYTSYEYEISKVFYAHQDPEKKMDLNSKFKLNT